MSTIAVSEEIERARTELAATIDRSTHRPIDASKSRRWTEKRGFVTCRPISCESAHPQKKERKEPQLSAPVSG